MKFFKHLLFIVLFGMFGAVCGLILITILMILSVVPSSEDSLVTNIIRPMMNNPITWKIIMGIFVLGFGYMGFLAYFDSNSSDNTPSDGAED